MFFILIFLYSFHSDKMILLHFHNPVSECCAVAGEMNLINANQLTDEVIKNKKRMEL